MEQLIAIGQVDSSDTLGTTLHHAAYVGNKKALKKVLDKGIHVDYPNDEGQTALFCASLGGHDSVVSYLLSAGADPNEKTNQGLTPLHAACYSGNVKTLMKLLKEGGDLRLHDHQGRSVKDWAVLNPTPKKRMKILEFLDKTRMFAMSSSGSDLLMKKASSKTLHRAQHRRNSVTKTIRERIGRPSIHADLERMAASQHSLGFGQVYSNGTDRNGFISAIPLVSEHNLKHDPMGETYKNGAFCVMESAWWDYSQVTVKKLHKDLDPYQGGVVDLLINEVNHIGKLRHPNILTLMGVSQTSNLDGLFLIYERITGGSLYTYLHQKMERLHSRMIEDISLQICDAIIFIHLQGLVHCAITSHAVSVINSHTFKLGNFEYMIEASKCEWGKKNAVASNTEENAVYNWMAPEVMMNMPPSFYCDMFSFCAVLWEIFHGNVPWDNQCSESIKSRYSKGDGLKVINGKMPEYYRIILDFGLQQDPTRRQLSFLHVRDMLQAAPKDAKSFVRTHFQHLHHNDDDGGNQSRSGSKPDHTNKPHSNQRNNQPGTSKDVDNNLSDRQRRKEKDRYRADKGSRESKPRRNTEKRHSEYQERETIEDKWQRNERANETRLQSARLEEKNMSENRGRTQQYRQLHYTEDGLIWEGVPKQIGDEFQYSVNVRKDASPVKEPSAPRESQLCDEQSNSYNIYNTQYGAREFKDSSGTDSTEDYRNKHYESTSADTGLTESDVPLGRQLEKKTSSMGNFCYLNIGTHQRTRSSGAKPACHGHYEPVTDEYSTKGKLTTAGSLYSLYNEHSPDLPLGQTEFRRDNPKYVTLPRRKEPSVPLVEADPNWFGGRGSVKNLAQVFQDQIKQHTYYQAVLDGSVNKQHSSEKMCDSGGNNSYSFQKNFGNHACNKKLDQELIQTPGSMESVSSSVTATEIDTSNIHQIAFDVDDESDGSKSSSSFTTGTSSDSHAVSEWVEHELRKIKRKLSKEMVSQHSLSNLQSQLHDNRKTRSPDLFDTSHNHVQTIHHDSGDASTFLSSSECTEVTPETSETYLPYSQEQGDLVKCGQMEEFYFDDEMYLSRKAGCASNKTSPWNSYDTSPVHKPPQGPRSRHNSGDSGRYSMVKEQPIKRGVKSNLPMRTTMKKTESPNKHATKVMSLKTDDSKKKISRIPTSRSRLTASKLKDTEEAFANIMTIRSSLDEAGKHQVTHKVKNLKTGGSSTMLNKLVNGQKIVTTFKAVS